MELGVGFNTPGIIKLPFWRMAAKNLLAIYACLNKGEVFCSDEILDRSLCIDRDLKDALEGLTGVTALSSHRCRKSPEFSLKILKKRAMRH